MCQPERAINAQLTTTVSLAPGFLLLESDQTNLTQRLYPNQIILELSPAAKGNWEFVDYEDTYTPQKVIEATVEAFTSQSLDQLFNDRQLDRVLACNITRLCKNNDYIMDSANLQDSHQINLLTGNSF